MTFNSIFFVLTLLPLLAFYYLRRQRNNLFTKLVVLVYSYFFYGMWNPAFLLLIMGSTLVDWLVALGVERYPRRRTPLILVSLISNLGTLGFFKYYNFFSRSTAWLATLIGVDYSPPVLNVLLPVGISFYIFQTLSYTIDVYRGHLAARRSLLDVAFFVTYFPQLVAGPIVRADYFLPQLEREPVLRREQIVHGIFLVLWGLFLKMVIADNVAVRVDNLFNSWQSNGLAGNWAAGMLFGVQIYCDFNGYSLIAIGLAAMMGFDIPWNFRAPYAAAGLSDFWRRWHVSLSSWLRDYLYIPLGGSRKGRLRTYVNLMLTMLLGGLWHGASVMFIIWGGIHGAALAVERLIRTRFETVRESSASDARPAASVTGRALQAGLVACGIVATYLVVSVTWIPFRAQNMHQCLSMMGGLFHGPVNFQTSLVRDFAVIGVMFVCHVVARRYSFVEHVARSSRMRFVAATAILLALYFLRGQGTEFIYFQF